MKNIRIFNFIGYFKGLYFYTPIYTLFLLQGNMTLVTIVMSSSVYAIAVFLSEIPTGIFGDIYGQKTSIIVGYLIEVFSVAILIIQPSALTFLILYFIRGVGTSFVSGSEEALLYESVQRAEEKNYKKIYSKFLSRGQFGFVFAAMISGLAYSAFGRNSFVPLIVASAVCCFFVFIAALFLDNYNTKIPQGINGSKMFSVLKESFLIIRINKTIRTLIIVSALTLCGEYFIQDIYQPYFETYHVSGFWLGAVLSIGMLLNGLALHYLHVVENKISIEKFIFWVNLILGGFYLGMTVLVSPVFLVGIYILMNGFFNLQDSVISDCINNITGSETRATVLSGVSFCKRFVQIFVTFGLGFVVAAYGTKSSLAVQGCYLSIGAIASYFLLRVINIGTSLKQQRKN